MRPFDSAPIFSGAELRLLILWGYVTQDPIDLKTMDRAFFEALDPAARVELLCRLHSMTIELSERVGQNSSNSSRPPSSNSPFSGPLPGLGGPLPGKPIASKPATGPGGLCCCGLDAV